jgi:hypothetical protein
MRFERLVDTLGLYPYFDLSTLRTLFPEEASTATVQVYRWKRSGRLLELRRGLYALAEPYRRASLHGPAVAEAMYRPSYLSLEWALGWYGLIPEKVVTYTSVSTRETRTFHNALGAFTYRTIKPELFFGHETRRIMDAEVRIAEPAKALVDYWYLETGDWTPARMESLRFDPGALNDSQRLNEIVEAVNRPRIRRALSAWGEYAAAAGEYEEIKE